MMEIVKPWLDQDLNDDKIRTLFMKKSFFNYLKIWSLIFIVIIFSVKTFLISDLPGEK